jgi:Heavy metal associated domain 2
MGTYAADKRPSLIEWPPMLTIAHEVPGRLRLVSPLLMSNSEEASALVRKACAQPGVSWVAVRSTTGSLIILHDGVFATRENILHSLEVCVTPYQCHGNGEMFGPLVEPVVDRLLLHAARWLVAALL